MKKFKPEILLDQKKPYSHLTFIVLALVVTTITIIRNDISGSAPDILGFFFILLVQLEAFIFIASRIFRELDAGITVKEFTTTVIRRFILFLVLCFFAALLIYLIFKYISAWILGYDLSSVLHDFRTNDFGTWVKSTLGGLSFGAAIFIVIQWLDALKREQKLREENLVFQNETLKNQINPHFLFNSLNTISSLVQNQPEAAENFINHLSSFYRYILENGQKDRVPLQVEVDFIAGYFNLHRIRDEEKILLDIRIDDTDSFQILPVSLQILVENAIKHNSATREKPLTIKVYIEESFIVVKNNLQRKASQLRSTETGLRNLSERVSLITGRDLLIEETNDFFTVKIPLLK
ncbi:MAG: histidine kinase [Bacteroidales bacterium]|nr:histidine kinase [Bacteroidales bacterium]